MGRSQRSESELGGKEGVSLGAHPIGQHLVPQVIAHHGEPAQALDPHPRDPMLLHRLATR